VKVEWSETAVHQLRMILASTHWKRAGYGQDIVDRIFHRASSLDPLIDFGAEVPEYGDPDIREVYEHPYRIIYRVDHGTPFLKTDARFVA
jgi:toxin ParE1/3/4